MTATHEVAAVQAQPDALPELVDSLIRLGWQLDAFEVGREHWIHVVRTLHHAHVLAGLRLIAVAGGQGAGKTTLVSTLYPAAADWLRPNLGRGERIPVCVIETPGCQTPRAVVVRREGASTKEKSYGPDEVDAWQSVLRGDHANVLMARLEVPPSLWHAEGSGFVLLPGFERVDGYWQTLMRVVLSTSTAAVVVTDEGRMADGMQERIVADLRATGADGRPTDVVVALSRTDGEDDDSRHELAEQAAKIFGVRPEEVVPFGPERDDPAGWVGRFVETVGNILPPADQVRRREAALLRTVIAEDVKELLQQARASFDQQTLADDEGLGRLDAFLQPFDQERDTLLDQLDGGLDFSFGAQGLLGAASTELAERIGKDGLREQGRKVKDLLKFDPQGRDRRLIATVRECWQPEVARRTQREVLDALADRRLGELAGIRAAAGQTESSAEIVLGARAALGLPQLSATGAPQPGKVDPENPTLLTAMAMLPAMAVATRGFVLDFADEHGRIDVYPAGPTLEQRIGRLTGDRKTLLAGTALFLGLDVAVDGDLDSPGAIAGAVSTLLTGKASGGAAASAAAAAPYIAAGVAVVATGMALIAAANRATRERADLGQRLLQQHRDVTVRNVRDGVAGLLRVTREILAARMAKELGIGVQQQRRYALLQAVNEVDNARYRLLRQRAGRDVA